MKILAIDSSTSFLSLSLNTGKEILERNIDAQGRQNELLMRHIDDLCRDAGLGPKDLDAIACTRGPGSFTGLRICMSAAKAVALALGIPLFTENTLVCQLKAAQAEGALGPGELILSIMDARSGRYFALAQEGEQEVLERGLYGKEELLARFSGESALVAAIEGTESLFEDFPSQTARWRRWETKQRGFSKELLQIALLRYTIEPQGDSLDCGLDYMKKSEAEESLETRRAQS